MIAFYCYVYYKKKIFINFSKILEQEYQFIGQGPYFDPWDARRLIKLHVITYKRLVITRLSV